MGEDCMPWFLAEIRRQHWETVSPASAAFLCSNRVGCWTAGQFSCLCPLTGSRSTGIKDLHHHMYLLMWAPWDGTQVLRPVRLQPLPTELVVQLRIFLSSSLKSLYKDWGHWPSRKDYLFLSLTYEQLVRQTSGKILKVKCVVFRCLSLEDHISKPVCMHIKTTQKFFFKINLVVHL